MFQKKVTTEEELRSIMGEPSELVKRKVISYLDHHCQRLISLSPFVVLATADRFGYCDASPRGDMPGFVRVIDEKHLLIPERPGNKRGDSLRNILSNPRIGLLFFIPGWKETLRVNGKACLVRDDAWLEQMAVNKAKPLIAIGVEVEECFIHCAKALLRSKLWQPEAWPSLENFPSAASILHEHARLSDMDVAKIEERLQKSYTKLY
ncbi:pyridoxamine 5'-phosphate oxidase family protein [Anoxybacteroides rupiense]|uniref:Pyridoxamine 5'-phosphate oxidase family protein n=1 Tax=Anoxybacteroides rupiense TaxID=311460 RepID=A0ABD5IT71_9BACL|nr:pyridoxamine 5'-phosphate oxidase family protein [Anoxybacillus rupiensis]MED5051515.1 pyridoxamine 5'-phosphate oxidase family protein [Anoxybacillus rupiensis]